MEVSKIRSVFDLEWLQLSLDTARMFALVPRGDTNNANSHGYICETATGAWRCAGVDTDGSMTELGIVPRRIDARQKVQKQVIAVNNELAKAKEGVEAEV